MINIDGAKENIEIQTDLQQFNQIRISLPVEWKLIHT